MKKFILGILLSAFCLSSFATPTFTAEKFIMTNTGSVPIFYALNYSSNEYSDYLCTTMNGIDFKSKVLGMIYPKNSETMSMLPRDNYIDFCRNTELSYSFSFGLTQDSASYNENSALLSWAFNNIPNQQGVPPFTWVKPYATVTAITPDEQSDGSYIIYIYSDSSQFAY